MSELPDSWVEASFTELFDVQGGTQPPKSTFVSELTEGYVQLLQIRDFGKKPVPTYIRDAKGLKKCRREDILIARYGASLGRILTGLCGAYNVAMAKVIIPEQFNRKFVYYLLKSEAFQAPLALVSRSAQNGFNKDDLAGFQMPIAPVAEQKRIADKLEAVLGRVDACRARLDRVPDLLKRFRQSVLTAATSGQLTEEWRDGNDLKQDWRNVDLESVADEFSYGSSAKSEKVGAIPVLRMGNIQSGKLDWNNLMFTSDSAEIAKYRLVAGDVLFNRTNSPELVGKTAVFCGEREAVYAGYLIRVRCSPCLLPDYLNYCLNSPAGRDYCWRVKTDGVSQSNINARKLAAFTFDLPTLPEQTEIVRRVEALFAFADRIEASLFDSRVQVERLTAAVLAKAFSGKLVPQDPNDEPASVLLERMRTQPAAPGLPRNGRKVQTPPPPTEAPEIVPWRATVAPTAPHPHEPRRLAVAVAARTKAAAVAPAPASPTPVTDLDKNDWMSLLREVLTAHGPCDRETVIQQAAYALDYQRAGRLVAAEADNAIRAAVRRRVVLHEGHELRVNRANIAEMEAEDRDFMKDQFLAAISQDGRLWIDREEAARRYALWFGFRRTGSQIQDRVKSLINGLIRDHRLEAGGTSIRRAAKVA